MYVLYTALAGLFAVLATPWWLYRAWRHGKYLRGLSQRFGRLPGALAPGGGATVWIHAVSVGEVLAARPLVAGLRVRHPQLRLLLSTTTATGQEVARTRVPGVDGVFYFPLDLPWIVHRTLEHVQPQVFVTVETELWPNLLRACRARGIRTALVNGRLSARSFSRYRLVRPLMRRVLADLDVCCAQGEESARRLVALGADPARVVVTGNLKFDALDVAKAGREGVLRDVHVPDGRPVVVAASTLRGEEALVLRAFQRVRQRWPDTLLIVAPRHPERFDEVETLCAAEGYRVARRTRLPAGSGVRADVLVLDTIGELAALLQLATVVFVGGSLVKAGGHNILEPAVHGKPVVFGPHMENFAEIATTFLRHEAAVQVRGRGELEQCLVDLLGDPVRRARIGAAARALVEANRGAVDRTLCELERVLPVEHGPSAAVVRPFRRR